MTKIKRRFDYPFNSASADKVLYAKVMLQLQKDFAVQELEGAKILLNHIPTEALESFLTGDNIHEYILPEQ
tara:strand:- start:245 stop:457 length:213 start_codon:yes stop_codon:yes gene_type:complete